MESRSKTGKVFLRPHKPGKKWKPVLLSLFPPSSSGVGRLEIQEMAGGGAAGDVSSGVRRHHPHLDRKVKVVRLSEVYSVLRLPPNAEACPMENMSAFCVESQDGTLVFAALKDDCMDWVDKLCLSSFKAGNSSGNVQTRMEENQIYASADEAPQFWVVVQKTEAAARCGLEGSFWLEVGGASLLLREAQEKNLVGEWPYEQLRRYGSHQTILTIEAGRRCSSGPGIFCFESSQVGKIFSLIQSSIKQRAPSSAPPTHLQPRSPLPKTPSMAAVLETKLKIQDRKSPSLEGPQEDRGGQPDSTPAPITLMPLPLLPTQTPPSRRGPVHQSDGIYADPATMKPLPTKALYIDPASVLPLKPPGGAMGALSQTGQQDSVYSEVLDRVSPHQNQKSADQKTQKAEEPVYTEPTTGAEPDPDRTGNKLDSFAHLYAKVCKPAPPGGPSPESESRSSATPSPTSLTRGEEPLDDIIYENLGII